MAAGGPGVVNLGINASGMIGQLNAIISSTTNYNTTIGQLNAQLNQYNIKINQAGEATSRMSGYLKALAAYASIQGLTQLYNQFQAATREAAEFSRSIGLIQTITADANMSFNEWAKGIQAVSDELGMPLAETSAAAYDLLSNQVTKAADTFDVLRVAGNLANLTNSSVTSSVNSLSNAINAYGYSSRDAEGLAAKFFTTVDLGRVRLNEMDATAGRVYESGKSLGVSFEEVNAGLVAITQTGVKTNTAMTLLVNLFTKLLKPTKDLQALYNKLGVGTGETFIKLYGLAGALKKIEEATHGSSAEASKHFNEIRGKQAYDILTDQMEAFNNALKEQATAFDRATAAKETYEKTPGFQAQKQAQELKNALTTGLKTELLETGLAITRFFGGVRQTMLGAMGAVGALSTSFIAFNATLALSTIKAREFKAALFGGLAPTGAAIVGAVLAGQYLLWQQKINDIRSMNDAFYEHWNEINNRRAEREIDEITKTTQEFRENLDERRAALLEYTTKARQDLLKIGTGLSEVGDKLRDQLRNAVELALDSAKAKLRELESQLSKTRNNITAARKAQADARTSQGDALYNYRMAADQARTGGANERKIMQARLNELNREAARAAAKGDMEALQRANAKAEALINQAATAVDAHGNLKYFGQERAITEFYRQRAILAERVEIANQRSSKRLEEQRAELQKQVKTAEDAGKELFNFSLYDKSGNARFSSKAEHDAAYEKVRKAYEDAIAVVRANGNAAPEFRGAGYIEQQRLLGQRDEEVRAKAREFFGNSQQQQANVEQLTKLGVTEAAISKMTAAALKQIQRLGDAAVEAMHQRAGAQTAYKTSLSNILAEGEETGQLFGGRLDSDFHRNILNKLAKEVDEAIDKGDYKTAQEKLNRVEDFLKTLGNFTRPIMQTGLKDANGNVVDNTPQKAVQRVRVNIAQLQRADSNARTSQSAYDAQVKAADQAVDKMIKSFEKWKGIGKGTDGGKVNALVDSISGGVTKLTESFIENQRRLNTALANQRVTVEHESIKYAEKPEAAQSHGGFAGYFAAGGEPRGIDTALVRMDPREFIMNPQASSRFRSQLLAMNQGWNPFSGMSQGPTTNVGNIHVHVQGGATDQQTIQSIAAGLRRGIRAGTIRLGG